MTSCYVLEYKVADSKGREKNAQFAGVFSTIKDIEKAKEKILKNKNKKITFQVYNSQSIFP
jgi:hypothetical protein|tara:strand:- start:574 stop:756 length:183 start_codon:yes stop_codon:yes gene_type:complete